MKTEFKAGLENVQEELFRFACKLTANREDANDLLQETLLKALDNEDKYIPDTNFKGWMYTIMRNIFINNYRKYQRDKTYVGTEGLNSVHNLVESVDVEYDLKEMYRILGSLQNGKALEMYLRGFTYWDIAEELHIPINTVKSRINGTRRKLKGVFA
ncbi:ECF RNA polymerase sigma factor SigH [termite gut metagenome]|uniref:RNA polymerase sigma factor SigS n=1 Tax=termite gut metagenome TaxID=433724 RepID=A0A5J4S377_9ZZZZ